MPFRISRWPCIGSKNKGQLALTRYRRVKRITYRFWLDHATKGDAGPISWFPWITWSSQHHGNCYGILRRPDPGALREMLTGANAWTPGKEKTSPR